MDYDSGPYIVTFPAGVTSAQFKVPINNDDIFEEEERFELNIDSSSLPSGVTVGDNNQFTMTIMDNDGNQIKIMCYLFFTLSQVRM